MEEWKIWFISGLIFILLEFVIPGAVVVFLGMAAIIVGTFVYTGKIENLVQALIAWFITSLILMIFLRSLFMKYFEGDSEIQNVDEEKDLIGSQVVIVEKIGPEILGRVKFRDTTWVAKGDYHLDQGETAEIIGNEDQILIIGPLKK